MYHHLRGVLDRKTPAEAILDVGGVGYRVTIPLSTYERLPQVGQEVRVLTTLVVREDAHRLFGFATEAERSFFQLLRGVSGVGPQVALGIVSSLRAEEFASAVSTGDSAALRRIKGVGKRLSERLVVELRDRVIDLSPTVAVGGSAGRTHDAVLALEALGFARAPAEKAVRDAIDDGGDDADPGEIVRRALRKL